MKAKAAYYDDLIAANPAEEGRVFMRVNLRDLEKEGVRLAINDGILELDYTAQTIDPALFDNAISAIKRMCDIDERDISAALELLLETDATRKLTEKLIRCRMS